MSNLSNILTRFTKDIGTLEKAKEAKKAAQLSYRNVKVNIDKLSDVEIKQQTKETALKTIETLKLKQKDFNVKSSAYADAVLQMQNDFEETYSTVIHSLVDTVYDARKMMHYLTSSKKSHKDTYKADNEAIIAYLDAYANIGTFTKEKLDVLIKKAKELNKYWTNSERKSLMSAFSRHEKEDLENLKTFIEKYEKLQEALSGFDLNESVDKPDPSLPSADEVVSKYAFLMPQIFDTEGKEELSMNDVLNVAFSALSKEQSAEKKIEFKYDFKIPIILPLYADPIIVVSFDFKLVFEFETFAAATASTKGSISTISLEATCSLSFGVSVALSLTIIQLIKASINAGIKLDTSVTAKTELKSQIAYFAGEAGLSAEAKLIAKTWISLSICGPVSAIIKAATGKTPELRWLLGELILFKLSMEKKAELVLNPMGKEFKAEANFRPLRDGFTVKFVGKEALKKKLNEKYNNKLAVIKQQFLSNEEMIKAHDDKVKLLNSFDVFDFDAGSGNDQFKKKVKARTYFMMQYESYFDNFMGRLTEEVLPPNSKNVQKTSVFINSYAIELKKLYHERFIELNPTTVAYFDDKQFKETQEEVWLDKRSSLRRVLAEEETALIQKLKKALTQVKDNQEYTTKLFALDIISLDYINTTPNVKFKEMATLIDSTEEIANEFIQKLVVGTIGSDACIFGFSSIEVFSSKRKQKHEAKAELKSKIERYITEEKSLVLSLGNLSAAVNARLKAQAIELKKEFDKRKTEEKSEDFHQFLADKEEEVIEYFEKISSQLDLQKLEPIEAGIKKIAHFHDKNKVRQEYIDPDRDAIMAIYKGQKEFRDLVKADLTAKYADEIRILANWSVEYDLYTWFKKDENQQQLSNLMSNVTELYHFTEDHNNVQLKKNFFGSNTNYEHYLEKDPEEMLKKLSQLIPESTS